MFDNIIALSLFFTAILGGAALSGVYSEKSGVVNIAINGFMIFGALFYSLFRHNMAADVNGWVQLPMMLIAGMIVAVLSLLHSFASITLKSNQVVSGTAINLLASGVALFIIQVIYKAGSNGMNSGFQIVAAGKNNLDWKYGISLPVITCFIIFLAAWVVLKYTRLGRRIQAAGENPQALASQGISVVAIRYISVTISGFLAGIAGAVFAQLQGTFRGDVQGLGFVAMAIMIFGQWQIPLVILAAVAFSLLNGLSGAINAGLTSNTLLRDNKELIKALPFVLSLVTLIFTSKRTLAPKAVGIPYDKSQR